jgi:hypothetical protein
MERSTPTGMLALAALLAVAPALGQEARELKKSALRGVETFIAVHSNYTQLTAQLACEEGPPVKIEIVTPPKNGTVATRPAAEKVAECAQRVVGTGIYYTSKPGFVGTDSFSYSAKAEGMAAKRAGAVLGIRNVTVEVESP